MTLQISNYSAEPDNLGNDNFRCDYHFQHDIEEELQFMWKPMSQLTIISHSKITVCCLSGATRQAVVDFVCTC